MPLTRRDFLAACVAVSATPRAAEPATRLQTAWQRIFDPVTGVTAGLAIAAIPWDELRQALNARYRDLRRHFVYEYYPWYGSNPFIHWNQFDRIPPDDLAGSSVPRLGAYDSRSTAVIEQHARWIAESGVGVVNLSWWGRDTFEDRAVTPIMDVMGAHDVHVAFHLEPYGPQRAANLSTDLEYLLSKYGEKRRWDCFHFHTRADGSGGPVFKLFNTTLPPTVVDCHGVVRPVRDHIPDAVWRRTTDDVRRRLDGRFDRVTLLGNDPDIDRVAAQGLDGTAVYDPMFEPDTWLQPALGAARRDLDVSFNVNPGLDEIPRRNLAPDDCDPTRPLVPSAEVDWSRPEERERARALSQQRINDSFAWSLLLQTHPWLGNVDRGFFLVYVTSFNEWHEGTQFEPMKSDRDLTPGERVHRYHNPGDGFYRHDRLTDLIGRLV